MTSYDALEPKSANPLDSLIPALQPRPIDSMMGNLGENGEQQTVSPYDVTGNMLNSVWNDDDLQEDLGAFSTATQKALDTSNARFKPDALEFKGVNWATPKDGSDRTFSNDPGFYNVDYDPTGKLGERLSGNGKDILAANVFGRQFSRDELLKDDEGRRLITLMEKQRTGEHRDEGFWKGVGSFSDMSGSYKKALADIPFIGWMVDGGSTVSETIAMSKAMRKMQNGEKVSDHEALAVRRYMLQQEMEGERGMGYNVGSLFHSSIPFMFEMAASSAMLAASAKAGLAIGTMIGGPVGTVVGGLVGVTGAVLFGGIGKLASALGKRGIKKGAEFGTSQLLKDFATRTFEQGFKHAEANAIWKEAADMSGLAVKEFRKAAYDKGRDRALVAIGQQIAKERGLENITEAGFREIASDALKTGSKTEFGRRARFEALKYLSEGFQNVYKPGKGMDVTLAKKLLVNGDVENMFHYGLVGELERKAYDYALPELANAPKGYWARRAAIKKGYEMMTEADKKAIVDNYVTGVVAGSLGEKLGGNGLTSVITSMSQALGGEAMVNNGFARQVADHMANNALRSLDLKYGAKTAKQLFANDMVRVGRFFADGALDGAFRWDTSIFGGVGTIARSGSTLGGKMNALKEAVKISMIEAPVRGAMQLTSQVPLWLGTSAALSDTHNPFDFTIKGQLGIQAQALRTGDKELMDHAKAVAFGSGLVEYVSENAGRGFNVFMSGIVKPSAMSLLPESTKDLGSWMARKMEAIYGKESLMKKENQAILADAIGKRIGATSTSGANKVTKDEIRRMVSSNSAKGIASLEKYLADNKTTAQKLIHQGIADLQGDGKTMSAVLGITAWEMMRRGLTPQKFADLMQRVGYDGIISEMAEERYGGFVTGLLGLDESASDSTWKDRISAAMRGLFPDPEQLVTEALGFAIPSVAHLSLGHVYNRLGQGVVSQIRKASAGLNLGMNSVPELVLPLDSPEYAQAVRDYRTGLRERFDARFGTEEGNREKVVANAETLFSKIKDGSFVPTEMNKQFSGMQSVGEVEKELSDTLDRFMEADSEKQLDELVSLYGGEDTFGAEGVAAIKNQWLRPDHHTNRDKEDFLNSGDFAAFREKVPLPKDFSTGPADIDDVVNRITASLPVIGEDQSPVSEQRSKLSTGQSREVRVNQYGEDLLSDTVKNITVIADAYRRVKNGDDGAKGWITRGLMRLTGVMDAVVTGDLSLAARNPVQWALAEESLDKDMLGTIASMSDRAERTGRISVLSRNREMTMGLLTDTEQQTLQPYFDRVDEARAQFNEVKRSGDKVARDEAYQLMKDAQASLDTRISEFSQKFRDIAGEGVDNNARKQFAAAGEASFQTMVRAYAEKFLQARNVLSVSRSDLSEAALQVVASRNRRGDGLGAKYAYTDASGKEALDADYRSDAFRKAHSENGDLEAARNEIVGRLVRLTTDGAIKVNTNAKFNVTQSTASCLDYQRAMRQGTPAEVFAAIKAMPAFAGTRTVHNLSGGQLLDSKHIAAFARTADIGELLSIPVDSDLADNDLVKVMRVLGREFVFSSPEENQREAKAFLNRVRISAEHIFPSSFEYSAPDRAGDRAKVTFSFSRDAKTGSRLITPVIWENQVPRSLAPTASVADAITALSGAGVRCQLPQMVFSSSFSVASRDATSMAIFNLGTRESAREYFVDQGVDNDHLPPYLRRTTNKDTGISEWEYDESDAAEQMQKELAEAGLEGKEATEEIVHGNSDKGILGYETVAENYLKSMGLNQTGISKEESLVLGGGQYWSAVPSSRVIGDTWLVTGDYHSSGDSEAMLRSVFQSAILNAGRAESYTNLTHGQFVGIMRKISSEFDRAADEVYGELVALRPDFAARVKMAADSFKRNDGRDVNAYKLATIAASVACFTSERGLGDQGNGFLLSPELAVIADRLRASEWTIPFLSAVDEALGGNGAFVDTNVGQPFTALKRVIEAFSPSGESIAASRRTSVFNRTGKEGAPKPGVVVPTISFNATTPNVADYTVEPRYFGDKNDLEYVAVPRILDAVSASCQEFSKQYRRNVSPAGCTTGEVFEMMMMRRADLSGGDTSSRLSVSRRKTDRAPRGRTIAGAKLLPSDSPGARPKTSERISDVGALKMGRELAFLIPAGEARDKALAGDLDEFTARSLAYGTTSSADRSVFSDRVGDFLFTRGMGLNDIDVVLGQLRNAIGNPVDGSESVSDDGAQEDADNAAAKENGGAEVWQDKKKTNDAVENKDLIEIGRRLMRIFPKEGRNHMAVFVRLFNEIRRIAASNGSQNLKELSRYFNVLRSRDGSAIKAISSATTWGDAEWTDRVLSDAVRELSDVHGRSDLAYVLNALRMIGGKGGNVRRAKALCNVGNMCETDAEYTTVTFGKDGTSVGFRRSGSGTVGCETAVRACIGHVLLGNAFKQKDSSGSVMSAWNCYQDLYGTLVHKEKYVSPATRTLENLLQSDAEAPINLEKSLYDRIMKFHPESQGSGETITMDLHAAVVKFANALAHRFSKAADAIDMVFGYGNEVTYALRNPNLVRVLVQDVEHMLSRKWKETENLELYRENLKTSFERAYGRFYESSFTKSFTNAKGTTYVYSCELINDLLLNPLGGIVRQAGTKDGVEFAQIPDMIRNMETTDIIRSATRFRFNPGLVNPYSTKEFVRSALPVFGKETKEAVVGPGNARSTLASVFRWYEESMPRSTARVPGETHDQFADSGTATQLPASPIVAQARLEDSLLSKVGIEGLKESYFANGSRFADGSRLIAVSAGARIGDEIADESLTSKLVFQSNVGSFVGGDMRNVKFQLYHGEKPTVYSVQLPYEVANALWHDVLDGKAYTKNRVTDSDELDLGSKKRDLDKIGTEEDRRTAYNLMFSVIASRAGCDEIDSKRTQVLMSQGTPFAAFRDSYRRIGEDGKEETVDCTKGENGEPVVPGAHFLFSVSGKDAGENLGMYFASGRLIEAQRSISTNPDAISFKNHLTDWGGVFLTKGQCHDIGLGIRDDEEVPTTGNMREAQRQMRRELERALGLQKNILDIPKPGEEEMPGRKEAVEAVERFRTHSTVLHSDLETQKAGPFGSRCGFFAETKKSEITLVVKGKAVSVRMGKSGFETTVDKAPEDGQPDVRKWTQVPEGTVTGKWKSNAYQIAVVIPIAMRALEIDALTDEDVASIESTWTNAKGKKTSGTLAESGIFHGMGSEKGDRLSFERNQESGGYSMRYFTRSMIGQIMANADASSKMSTEHPAATNYDRDQIANQGYLETAPGTLASEVLTVARALPIAILRNDPGLVKDFIDRDDDFAYQSYLHRYSDYVRSQGSRKENAVYAKACRVYPMASHAVLLGSGIKADIDRRTHKATFSATAGVTDYDRDAVRSARILTSDVAKAYGVDRTYSSGLINVTGDDTFRYGWHLDMPKMQSVRSLIDRVYAGEPSVKERHDADLKMLTDLYGDSVDKSELEAVADISALAYAAHRTSMKENRDLVLKDIFGAVFTDYTGKPVGESPRDVTKASLSDLFTDDGRFDFAALEFGKWKKVSRVDGEDGKPVRTVYLGGSFFSADRRPSGNFESASGFARAQAPVTVTADGMPGKTAMYILDPVQNAVQGSDTDGDSATATRSAKYGASESDRMFVREVFDYLTALRTNDGIVDEGKPRSAKRAGRMTKTEAHQLVYAFKDRPEYRKFFRESKRTVGGVEEVSVDLNEETFHEALGNLLFECQIGNYRGIQTREQNVPVGSAATLGTELADEAAKTSDIVYDVGFAGRDPVGPDAVFDTPVSDADADHASDAAKTYHAVTGRWLTTDDNYADAFHECIDELTKETSADLSLALLDPELSAFLSAGAADASGARGVMVSLQAAIEHIKGYTRGDTTLQKLAPALYTDWKKGDRIAYDALRDFVAHLDGISNALFDVVKDLFAPRAGWQKNMLNYLIAKLVSDANSDYERLGTNARFGDSWFFVKLVGYARDFHSSPTSIPGLLRAAFAGNNYLEEEKFGTADPVKTLRGLYHDAMKGETVLRYLAEVCPKLDFNGQPTSKSVASDSSTVHGLFNENADGTVSPEDNYFEDRLSGWLVNDLIPSLGRRGSARTVIKGSALDALISAAREGTLPVPLRNAIFATVDAGEETYEEAAMAFADKIEGISRKVRRGAEMDAILGSFLLADTDGDVSARLDAAVSAADSLDRLNTLLETEDGLSPEPSFQQGGRKAVSLAKKMSATFENADPANSSLLTQAFVNADRLSQISSSQFDSAVLSDRIKGEPQDLASVLTVTDDNPDVGSAYRRYLSSFSTNPLSATVPLRTDNVEDVRFLVAAMYHGSRSVSAGHVNTNRKELGHIAHAIMTGVESSRAILGGADTEQAVGRFMWLMNTHYASFATSEETLRRRAEDAMEAGEPDPFDLPETGDVFASSSGKRTAGTTLLGRIVTTALSEGAEDPASKFLQMLNVDEFNGRITLESRLGPDAAASLRDGFDELRRSRYEMSEYSFGPSGMYKFTMADLATLIEMHLCSSQAFDSVAENDTRVDVTSIFTRNGSDSDLVKMERWGVALENTLLGRALMRVPQSYGAYDLFHKAGGYSGGFSIGNLVQAMTDNVNGKTAFDSWKGQLFTKVGEELIGKAKDEAGQNPLEILVNALFSGSSVVDAHDAILAKERDEENARASRGEEAPENNEYLVASSFVQDDGDIDTLEEYNRAPFGFTDANGDEAETIEAAVNSYSEQYIDFLGSLGKTPEDLGYQKYVNLYIRGRMNVLNKDGSPNPYAFANVISKVIEDTRAVVGDAAFGEYLKQALAKGGDYQIHPATHDLIRKALQQVNDELNPKADEKGGEPKARIVQGPAETVLMQRMIRSGFAEFLREKNPDAHANLVTNPFENIKFALETAFGKWNDKSGTGVKVEQVRHMVSGVSVPTGLVRVTRKLKTNVAGTVRTTEVTTYISCGERIDLDVENEAYLESVVNALGLKTDEERAKMLGDLRKMDAKHRQAFVNAQGLRVDGESNTRLTTDALLALTGLVRLGSGADYFTLFHEYFHQMIGFCRKTGICTDADMAELSKAFSTDGKFDEERAADAFAEYVAGAAEAGVSGKLLRSGFGGDIDDLFRKFHRTASALLAGGTAFDSDGAPVFLKMVVTGDFSKREMQRKVEMGQLKRRQIENTILERETDYDIEVNYMKPDGAVARGNAAVTSAVITGGDAVDALNSLVEASVDSKNLPAFDGKTLPFGIEPGSDEPSPEKPTPAYSVITDPNAPRGQRVHAFLEEALKQVDSGDPLTVDEKYVVRRLRTLAPGLNENTPECYADLMAIANRVIDETCAILGFDRKTWLEDDKNTVARSDVSRDENLVTELAVRLARKFIAGKATVGEDGRVTRIEEFAPKAYASLREVMDNVLARISPADWPTYVSQMAVRASDAFSEAARDYELRASALVGGRNPSDRQENDAMWEEYDSLRAKAADCDARSYRLSMVTEALVRGDRIDRFVPAAELTKGDVYQSLFTAVTGGVQVDYRPDGTIVYRSAQPGGLPDDGRHVQRAIDLTAQAIGAAVVLHRHVIENGLEKPVVGALPQPSPLAPVIETVEAPEPGVLVPDTTPQMILQSQSSWMASDLQRDFFGVNLRDIMTDTSLEAVAEETNRIANRIDQYFGADTMMGDKVREITYDRSNLAMVDGAFRAGKEHEHTVQKSAAVRGYLLGIVNRSAKTAGEALTFDDVNMINVALQTAGIMASGDGSFYTEFDVADVPFSKMDPFNRVSGKTSRGTLDAKSAVELTGEGKWFNPLEVLKRAKARPEGATDYEHKPSNLDMLLYRLMTSMPTAITGVERDAKGYPTGKMTSSGGVYSMLIDVYSDVWKKSGKNSTPSTVRKSVVNRLKSLGYADVDCNGRAVLTIPCKDISDTWDGSSTVDKLVAAGRRKQMLGLTYVAQIYASDASRLNRAASKTRFLNTGMGTALSGQNYSGLWFENGSGHHGLVVSRFRNAEEFFDGKVSDDLTLERKFRSFMETVTAENRQTVSRFVKSTLLGTKGGTTVVGLKKAFATDENGTLVNVSTSKIGHLIHLLGGSRRANIDDEEVRKFVTAVRNGRYLRDNPENRSGFNFHKDMTLFELDREIFEIEAALLEEEVMNPGKKKTVFTKDVKDGGFGYGKQDLIDLNEVLRRVGTKMMLDEKAENKISGKVVSLRESTMFRKFGQLGSSKTGSERLRSMAEGIAHAERFRGCLSQMLTTVGVDGQPNYIVRPGAGAEALAPDAYWGALAKFVSRRFMRTYGDRIAYDDTVSGIANMERVFDIVSEGIRMEGKSEKRSMPWIHVPPDPLHAGRIFSDILALSDGPEEDTDLPNRAVGGEAAGYLKQLFGTVSSPSVWHGWRTIDRMMAYSKVASVGMSAFFTFATRFESPVAACGFMNTALGYSKRTADLGRKLGKLLKDTGLGEFFNFDENQVYLADIMNSVTSDDPAIRDMRELCSLVQIPLSNAIRNPMSDVGSQVDNDIKRLSAWLVAAGHEKLAREMRGIMKAAFQNPGEYAFSNVLNCVQMAVVAQTMVRLRRECERSNRPFDPVKELRKYSSYLSSEIGGINPARYAWLTPGMQRILRNTMFSWQWTMSAWTAGGGEVLTDMIFGGHHTTKALRQQAFVRWMRMLGIVKVGVPVVMQGVIRGLATAIQRSGLVGDPDDPKDADPLGIEQMPWLCFDNESKIGSLCFDVTPLLRLAGRIGRARDEFGKDVIPGYRDYVVPSTPWITAAVGAVAGAKLTRSFGGTLIGLGMGAALPKVVPTYDDVGHGRNTSGRRRYYMHFGKQSDEFWRWFTSQWQQATNKLSIPLQKTVEAFYGSTNGSNFGKKFMEDENFTDRFIRLSLDPNENAIVNWFTAFVPFSAASVMGHPDCGVLGMFAPVQMGASMTGSQKRVVNRLKEFALDDTKTDVWANPRNKKRLEALCADILSEARLNGMDPKEVMTSALGTVTHDLYVRLFDSLPKRPGDPVDAVKATEALRGLYRMNRKLLAIKQSLATKYRRANVDWKDQRNARVRQAVKAFLMETRKDPWLDQETSDAVMKRFFDEGTAPVLRSTEVQQDAKGGENFANFLATDEVPETLFGIPIVSRPEDYTADDIAFFKANPEAGGYYDMGDGNGNEAEPPEDPDPTDGGPGPRGAYGGGDYGESRMSDAIRTKMRGSATEKAVYDALFANGDKERRRAFEERLSRYDEDSRRRILEAGITDLESVPIVPPGETGTWNESMESRKSQLKKSGSDKAERFVIAGEEGEGRLRGTPGLAVYHRLKRSKLKTKKFNLDHLRENDNDRRSYAMPQTSIAVVHDRDAFGEEVRHLVTPVLGVNVTSDGAKELAVKAGMPKDAAYHVYGNANERTERMLSLKSMMNGLGYDFGVRTSREGALDTMSDEITNALHTGSFSEGDKIMLREMIRLRSMKEEDMKPEEKEAWKWLNDDSAWKQVKVGEPGTGVVAASKGGYVNLPRGAYFSTLFEAKPVVVKGKDGKTYYKPTRDKAGKYDIGGYRSYWSAKKGRLVTHTSDGLLPESAFLKGREKTEAYFDAVLKSLYGKYGVDSSTLGKGVSAAARDIVFNTGGDDFLNASPKFSGVVRDLKAKGLSANDAFGMALALEQDSYGNTNNRRFAARGGIVMDDLEKSSDPTVRRFSDAYRGGWDRDLDNGWTPVQTEDAYGTNWARHASGMREAAKVADELGLDYSARGNK